MDQRTLDAATAHLDPPFAVVDLAAFDRNAADLVRRADGLPIRVASKSVRCRPLLERALRAPGYAGVMAYSLPEALWLNQVWAGTEFDGVDILVAYPTADRAALRALAACERARAAVSVVVDSVAHLDFIAELLGHGHPEIRVCLELDVSWRPLFGDPRVHVGALRSPVFTPAQARALAVEIGRRPGFALVGVMAYEGQIAGLGDDPTSRPRGAVLRWMRKRSGAELLRRRAAAIRAVRSVAELEFVNGGGTGSVELTRADPSVTEIAAGSGLVGPALFDDYRAFTPRPALLYAVPVVRRPAPGVATVFAGGYLASGPADKARLPRPHLPAGLRLTAMEGAGEVQTPVLGEAADRLGVGDRVWMRHAKAGEPAERFTEYHLVDGDEVVAVPTYRGEGKNFG